MYILKVHFKLQQEVLTFNMYVSWSSPKTDLVKNFSNLEALRTSFFSIVTFKLVFDIPLLNNLFAYFLNLSISLIELINTH